MRAIVHAQRYTDGFALQRRAAEACCRAHALYAATANRHRTVSKLANQLNLRKLKAFYAQLPERLLLVPINGGQFRDGIFWMKSPSSHHLFLVVNESEGAYARAVGYVLCDEDGNVIPELERAVRLHRALLYAAAHEFAWLRLPRRPSDRPIVRNGKAAWRALTWATNYTLAVVDYAITVAEEFKV